MGQLSSRNLPWVYDLFGPSTSFPFSPSSFFFVGNQGVQNWNVGLFRSLSCDLLLELDKDGVVMNIGPGCGPGKSTISDRVDYPSQVHWPLV